ncbi:P-loop containing nucleoside triphosphate hydrolase protein [Neoconidiobolus thromboides FSU 785]|nr:P-loop containing nucleoside triphosphate hydrolase protein [Neoconidiobolus thromboides FSU 785]
MPGLDLTERIRKKEFERKNTRVKKYETPSHHLAVSNEYLDSRGKYKKEGRSKSKFNNNRLKNGINSFFIEFSEENKSAKEISNRYFEEQKSNKKERDNSYLRRQDVSPGKDKYENSYNYAVKKVDYKRNVWDSTPTLYTNSSNTSSSQYSGLTLRSVFPTPRFESINYDQAEGFNHIAPPEVNSEDWENEQRQLDRDWYNMEEGGAYDQEHNPFVEYQSYYQKKEEEKAAKPVKKITARQMYYDQENEKWETNQLANSGAIRKKESDMNYDEDSEDQVHILVHDNQPPFLDGRVAFTRQTDPVMTVKDPTSDLAVFSKKGSKLLKERREQREKQKATREKLDMTNSTLGKVMGMPEVKEKERLQKEKEMVESGQISSSNDSKFADHMKEDSKGVTDFSRNKTLKQQREYLPAFAKREEILKAIRDNQVVVVIGFTGSGKTTQLTQYLYESGYGKNGIIGCTQPRRVAAMSVAKRVSEETETTLGELVGYTIRFEDCTSPKTRIKCKFYFYMTAGVLLRETLRDSDLDQYSAIIMDEAHERALDTDVLMGLLKKVIARRRDIRVIITSATMNSEKFSDFFGRVPIVEIKGKTFPVDVLFHKTPCEDYVESAIQQVFKIHLSNPSGDILVFMTGQEDIEVTAEIIKERLSNIDKAPPLSVLPIYSQMPADLQARIFQKAPKNEQTSLTVDGIIKLKVYNPRIGMDALQITPISKANANQRSGRAGRTGPGIAYRMYTEQAYNHELLESTIPEIQRTNLCNVVLLLKSLGVRELLSFDFLDPPPQDTLINSMYQLWVFGALNNLGELTPLGERMVQFPLDPCLSKMLITSEELECTAEVVTIVSMLSVPNVFYRPKERIEESDAAREKFLVAESDHLTLLNVYNLWRHNGYRDDWCTAHFLHSKALYKAKEVRTQLLDIMKQEKIPYVSSGNNTDLVRRAICSAYFHHAAKLKGIGEYYNLRTGMPCQLHPTSSMFGRGFSPEYIVYNDLVMTSKEYMQCVSQVDPEWLAELGSIFYSIKNQNFGHREKRIKNEINKMDMEKELQEAEVKKQIEDSKKASYTPKPRIVATPGVRSTAATPRPFRKFGL